MMGVLITAQVKTALWAAWQTGTHTQKHIYIFIKIYIYILCCSVCRVSNWTVPKGPPAKQETWSEPQEMDGLNRSADPAGETSDAGWKFTVQEKST